MPAIITNSPSIVSPKTGKAKRIVAGVTNAAAVTKAAAAPATPAVAKPAANPALRGVGRDIAGIAAQRTNFAGETPRDRAYLSFFARHFAGDKRDATFTLAAIRESGRVPAGDFSSAKPTDVGAINRLVKNGMLTFNGDKLTFTAKAQAAKLD